MGACKPGEHDNAGIPGAARGERSTWCWQECTRPLEEEDLDVEVLSHDRHFVVAGTRSRWARQRKVALSELVNEPWIFSSDSGSQGTDCRGVQSARIGSSKGNGERGLHPPAQPSPRNRPIPSMCFPIRVLRYNAKQWSLKDIADRFRREAEVDCNRHSEESKRKPSGSALRRALAVGRESDVCDIGSDWHNRRKRKWGCIMQPLEGLARPEGFELPTGSRPGNRGLRLENANVTVTGGYWPCATPRVA